MFLAFFKIKFSAGTTLVIIWNKVLSGTRSIISQRGDKMGTGVLTMKPNGRNKQDLERLSRNTILKWSPSGLGADLIRPSRLTFLDPLSGGPQLCGVTHASGSSAIIIEVVKLTHTLFFKHHFGAYKHPNYSKLKVIVRKKQVVVE